MLKIIWKMLFPNYTGKRYSTVRYAFPLIVISAIFASLAALITENSSYVTIRTDEKTVVQGESFYIDVTATAHVPVNAIDLVINYPEDKMDIEGIDTGTSVITLWTEEPHAEKGNIYLRGGTFRKGFIGEHTIARIKAHATESGEARIIVKDTQLVAGDGLGTEVAVTQSETYNEAKILVTGADGVISGMASISVVSDIDGNGTVDLKDITTFMAAWFTRSNVYDFNGDGRMTFTDFSILLADSFRS